MDELQSALRILSNVQPVDENKSVIASKIDRVQFGIDGVQATLGKLLSAMQVGEN